MDNIPTNTSFDWEQCKENAAPLKRGRSVRDLSQKPHARGEVEKWIEELDNRLQLIEDTEQGQEGVAQLEIFREIFTKASRKSTDSAQAKTILERATKELLEFPSLKNDIRYIKLWIEYADLSSEPFDVFNYMAANNLGTGQAVFWVAWAFIAEKCGRSKQADTIYSRGLRCNPEHRELLQKRYRHFQRRLARKLLSGDSNDDSDPFSTNFATQLSLNHVSAHTSPAITAPTLQSIIHANQPNQLPPVLGERRPLGERPIEPLISIDNPQGVESLPPSVSARSRARVRSGGLVPLNDNGFNIFQDTGEESMILDSNGWSSFPTDHERRKENEVPISKWTQAPLTAPNESGVSMPIGGSVSNVPTVSIPIFVEESFRTAMDTEQPQPENSGTMPTAAPLVTNAPKDNGLFSIFADENVAPSTKATTKLGANPLKRAKLEPVKASVEDTFSGLLGLDNLDEDQTINTRLAMRDIGSMFASPSGKGLGIADPLPASDFDEHPLPPMLFSRRQAGGVLNRRPVAQPVVNQNPPQSNTLDDLLDLDGF